MIKLADISLLNSCNFRCDYCKSGSIDTRQNSKSGNAWDVNSPVIDFGSLVEFIRENLKGYLIQFTGGEPLTLPGVEYLINEVAKTNKVVICTNGAMLPQKARRINSMVFYRVSAHPDQRRLSELFKSLNSINGCEYIVNYVVHPRHLENGTYKATVDELNKKNINYELTPFEGEYNGKNFRLFDPVYDGLVDPKKELFIEMEIVVVQPNGRVYSCHGKMDHSKPIGDIYTGDFNHGDTCKMNCSIKKSGKEYSICPMYDPIMRMLER